jgi:hypothetical protein
VPGRSARASNTSASQRRASWSNRPLAEAIDDDGPGAPASQRPSSSSPVEHHRTVAANAAGSRIPSARSRAAGNDGWTGVPVRRRTAARSPSPPNRRRSSTAAATTAGPVADQVDSGVVGRPSAPSPTRPCQAHDTATASTGSGHRRSASSIAASTDARNAVASAVPSGPIATRLRTTGASDRPPASNGWTLAVVDPASTARTTGPATVTV